MKKAYFRWGLFGLALLSLAAIAYAGGGGGHGVTPSVEIPAPLESYNDSHLTSIGEILSHRASQVPFNVVASLIFLCAIIHTFLASRITKVAHDLHHQFEHDMKAKGMSDEEMKRHAHFGAEIMHFLGEVEAIFGIWVIVLAGAILGFYDWSTMVYYLGERVNYTEPMFVVVIMALASTRPILKLAEACLKVIAGFGKGTPAAWWLTILTVAPLLGSFITEPAAMTIAALLLAKQFYDLKPSPKFAYGTIGLVFVNTSVGGTLTHFAAPPVLMVAAPWNWDMAFMMQNFGWKATIGIIIANAIYFIIFKKEFENLTPVTASAEDSGNWNDRDTPIPAWITLVHVLFMAWTVLNAHHPALFIGGFLFFLGFSQATASHQNSVELKPALLVGFFLAGLVTHGGLQSWWIAPVLGSLDELPLMLGAVVLTAFNDNAAITYLSTLVPNLGDSLKYAVVAGAVTGGGLTVIANAPNPAGQSILSRYFEGGVSPLNLLISALIPTVIMGLCFMLL